MADRITFFASYYEAFIDLEDAERLKFYDAIMEYAFGGIEPDFMGGMAMAWKLIKPNLDKSMAYSEAGKKGRNSRDSKPPCKPASKGACRPSEKETTNETQTASKPPCKPAILGKGVGEGEGKVLVYDQNQNLSSVVDSEENGDSDAALPKGAAPTAGISGEVKFDGPPSKEASADIAVIREQLSAVQAELDHDPSNAYFAREVQRLKARLHRIETKGARR